MSCGGRVTGLSLTGGVTEDGIIICRSPSAHGLNKLFDEMTKIQNEQLNALRTTLKEQQLDAACMQRSHHEMLEDFSRLNNEFVNTATRVGTPKRRACGCQRETRSLATTDGLTGLKNHRAFQEELERQFASSASQWFGTLACDPGR